MMPQQIHSMHTIVNMPTKPNRIHKHRLNPSHINKNIRKTISFLIVTIGKKIWRNLEETTVYWATLQVLQTEKNKGPTLLCSISIFFQKNIP